MGNEQKKEWIHNPDVREAESFFLNIIDDSDLDVLSTLMIITPCIQDCEESIKDKIRDVKMSLPGDWQVSNIIDGIKELPSVLNVKELQSITCYV